MKKILFLAGLYNLLWGGFVVLFPLKIFELINIMPPRYPEIWQCVGMIVGVYGLGYIIAARAPYRHWPIILVGFLGKIFGPIGFLMALYNDVFPIHFGINIIFNDLIWWIPFSFILYRTYQSKKMSCSSLRLTKDQIQSFETRKRASFVNSLSGFKSANLIGTHDLNKKTNLSIVSSLFHLGSSPALMGFIIRPDSARRDTIENIRVSKYFTINHVHEEIYKRAHQTSARYDHDQSEFDYCDLTAEYHNEIEAPFVKEAYIKMGMKLVREEKIPENGTHLIIAEVQSVLLPSNCLRHDGSIDIERAGTIAISGLDQYHQASSIARLSYAKVDRESKEVF